MDEKVAVHDTVYNGLTGRDEADMAEQGKRQQFKRNFGFWSTLAFTATLMATWEAVFFSNNTALLNGGPPTLIYGFIFCWIGSFATAASLAEMVSIAPTSGGQYHWVAILAPPAYSKFLSWIVGWIASIGWIANTAAGVFFAGTMIQGLLVLNYPLYNYQRWHGTLLLYAALLASVLVNTVGARLFPKIEIFVLFIHTCGFLALLVPLVYFAPHGTPSDVFATFSNEAGWNSNGLAWFIGLISANLPFIGYDGPAHMVEEVRNASTVVPWVMILTILLNGALGFAIAIAFSFCTGDLPTALNSPTGYDFIEVFFNATNSNAGSSVMTAVLIALVTCASFGFLASASRQVWAFARDRGLPFSRFLAHVNPRTTLPLNAILLCAFCVALLGLINIGSTVAFNAIVSLTIAGLYGSYLIPILLLLLKRAKNDAIRFGPWRMGRAGLPVNVVAVCFLLISIVFSFFPPGVPVNPVTMNWSVVVFWGAVILGLGYYAVRGRRGYQGPVVEVVDGGMVGGVGV